MADNITVSINSTDNQFHVKPIAAGNSQLDTSGKYMDRNIIIENPAAVIGSQSTATNTVSPSGTATGFTASSSATSYYVTPKATSSWAAKKSVTTAGFAATQDISVSGGVSTATSGTPVYIPTAAWGSQSTTTNSVSPSGTATGFTASDTATDYYVTPKATSSWAANKAVTATGIIPKSSSVSLSGGVSTATSGTPVYIPASSLKNGSTAISSGSTITPGASAQTINIAAGYAPARTIVVGAASSGSTATIEKAATLPSGKTEWSGTPILDSNGYLHITAGYTDEKYLSLKTLTPDDAVLPTTSPSTAIQQGYSAYNNDGVLLTGSMHNVANSELTVSTPAITTTSVTLTDGDPDYYSVNVSVKMHAVVSAGGHVTANQTGSDVTQSSNAAIPCSELSGALVSSSDATTYPTGYSGYKVYASTAGYIQANGTVAKERHTIPVFQGTFTTL